MEAENDKGIKLSAVAFNMIGAVMASNPWAVILGGNIDLSIAITSVANIFGYALTSLWLYIVATLLHKNVYHPFVEYERNLYFFCIPICIGITIKLVIYKIFPRAIDFSMEFLKWLAPVAVFMALIKWLELDLDLFVYGLFTWKSMLIAFILSVAIYSITWILLLSLNQSHENCISIAVEAANKNACLAVFVIRLLSQEQCDFACLFPSATVLMTFLMLMTNFLWNKCRARIDTAVPFQRLEETYSA
ncbi:uncharacterized protein LOC129566849 isoform X2 [Sitodiplosis mosellana]|nr:uncharacterized protein LOC129566849 isoform X2 [Sitodiplosis mosellana]